MNENKDYIIKLGQVESIEDISEGGRIKVRLSEDKGIALSDLPYAFPCLPKTLQSVPKVGECALVITAQKGNGKSQRYYIGPIVSQMQEMEYAPYNYGVGKANSLLDGAIIGPRKPINQYAVTDGAFPDKNDVALIGRKSEDIILKDGEIDLRCGIRQKAYGSEDKDLVGPIVFNADNPAYLQMKYGKNLMDVWGDSVVNVVADKVNLISHKNTDRNVNLVNPNSKDGNNNNPLLNNEDIKTLMMDLHQVPYGDILVKILQKMCDAITQHTHAMSGLPPCDGTPITQVKAVDLNSILSPHIRIS